MRGWKILLKLEHAKKYNVIIQCNFHQSNKVWNVISSTKYDYVRGYLCEYSG